MRAVVDPPPSILAMQYAFAPGVFACVADDRLIILNVPADRYLMLPSDAEASIRRLVERQPATSGDDRLRERLCTNGLVLRRASHTRLELCQSIEPTQSLIDDGWPRPTASGVAVAGLRAFEAAIRLKAQNLNTTLRRFAAIPAPVAGHADRVIGIAAAFAELRFIVRALDRCLPLSVALASAAKRKHAGVRLILGVRRDPFCAHAWVQLDATVLNDRLDTVRTFTPILAI